MTTFLLIRHGETDAVGKSLMGWMPGWHLNDRGRHQVETLAGRLARLPIRAIYTSPLERAIETAEAIARAHGLAPQPVEGLGEVHVGEWEGLSMAELEPRPDWRQFNSFRSGARPPGGEMMIEVQTRMIRQFQRMQEQHREETVAVVSHGDPLRSVVASSLGLPLDLMLRFEIAPASVSVLEVAQWGPRVLGLNETGDVPL
jgi:probable phosphomutase (TIGR03848 family)